MCLKEEPSMWAFVVTYTWPEDPPAFERYYRAVHVPMVKKFPGLRKVTLSFANQGEEGGKDIYMISTMYWDNLDSLRRALLSPEREAAHSDSARFRQYQLGRHVCRVDEV